MKITILGSCRQDSLYGEFEISNIQRGISYPHYTKEIIEVIKFCKYGHLTPEQTLYTFRTPILEKRPIYFSDNIKNDFESSNIFVVEIASKIDYQYDGIHVHHISSENEYNTVIKNEIKQTIQSKDEIEDDIISIKKYLKSLIIVGHIVTYDSGDRYNLLCWIEEICNKHNILFINPVKELLVLGYDINNLIVNEKVISHYNYDGHNIIKKIYKNFINRLSPLHEVSQSQL